MSKKWYPGTLRQGKSGNWYWEVQIGRERHRATFQGTRAEASAAARTEHTRLLDAHERQHAGLLGRIRMTQLINQYLGSIAHLSDGTVKTYNGQCARFRAWFKEHDDPYVETVRAGHIKQFLNARRAEGVEARTVAKDRTVLHAVFAFAEELEIRDGNPVARTAAIKWDPREPVILDADEFERLYAECVHDPMLALYVLCMAESGARTDSEVLWLRWEDVDLEAGFLHFHGRERRTKSGRGRHTPMTPRLAAALRDHFAAFRMQIYPVRLKRQVDIKLTTSRERSPWVFHHRTARRHGWPGARIVRLRQAFYGARDRAELNPELVPHDLRHRRVTTWIAEGRDVTLVKEAVGHADLRTTMGYTHLAKEHLRKLVEPLPAQQKSEKFS